MIAKKNTSIWSRGLAALLAIVCVLILAVGAFAQAPEDQKFVMTYPEDMQALGFMEPLVLESVPQRIVCLSTAPVLALYEMGAKLVGIPSSRVVSWPEELKESTETVQFFAMSSSDFDYESIVALEADLVLVGSSSTEVGEQIQALGIPVYYVFAGHTVSYDNIKNQTAALTSAFSVDEASTAKAEEIMSRFTALEDRLAAVQPVYAGKKVMVLQSGDASNHYIQTARGTLASMAAMMGFENVYENEASSMAKLDFEQALDYNPELVLCVGSGTAQEHQALMEQAYSENEAYWYSIDAIKNGDVIYLPVEFCSTAGIHVVDSINTLIDCIEAFYAEK